MSNNKSRNKPVARIDIVKIIENNENLGPFLASETSLVKNKQRIENGVTLSNGSHDE